MLNISTLNTVLHCIINNNKTCKHKTNIPFKEYLKNIKKQDWLTKKHLRIKQTNNRWRHVINMAKNKGFAHAEMDIAIPK